MGGWRCGGVGWGDRPSPLRTAAFTANPCALGNPLLAQTKTSNGVPQPDVYLHTDALGSIVAESNASGIVSQRNDYAPYGEAYSAPIDGLGYTGHEMDADTGLVYAQQRYYDPVIGRFLSVDPVGVDTSNGSNFSRYWYANNNPYRFTDPDGRSPIEIAFFVADAIELANSISSGEGIGLAALNVVIDVVGVVSPVPGISAAAHAIEGAQKVERVVEVAKSVEKAADAGKVFSKEKQALVDMAKADKKTGITSGDMKAFKDLNKKLPDPFPTNKVRGPEAHPTGAASSQAPHGYVGPVDHIPVKDKK